MVSLTIATIALNPNQEMTDFDYKKYSLENLENWMHDAMSSAEATPQEIYDTIVGVVKETYYHHKDQVSRANELLALLNGNVSNKYEDHLKKMFSCDKDDQSPECKGAWGDFWEDPSSSKLAFPSAYKEDKILKWQLPVQVDGLTGDCFIELPDDLLEVAGLKEGDTVEWIDRNDGSFEMRKVTKPIEISEC